MRGGSQTLLIKFYMGVNRPSFRVFLFGSSVGSRIPPFPWSIGIISLHGNVKLNLVAQSVARKILISKSLGVCGRQVSLTADALEIIMLFLCVAQGQMSHWAVEI